MAGIGYYNLQEIPQVPEDTKIITFGTILAVFKEQMFLGFVISDLTSSAETSFYQRKVQYEQFILPKVGQTIEILGTCSTKPMANGTNKLFLKIRIDRFRVLNFIQQIDIIQRTINSRKRRIQKQLCQVGIICKKQSLIKDKIFSERQMADVRSLIFSYMYIVFSSNKDITSYLFCPTMVTGHKISKDYAKDKQISEDTLLNAVKKSLKYMLEHDVIEMKIQQKQSGSNKSDVSRQNYIIRKKYFQRLTTQIDIFLHEKFEIGVTLDMITMQLNQKLGKSDSDLYVFNSKFTQKMVQDMINDSRVYKTSDKKLYPSYTN